MNPSELSTALAISDQRLERFGWWYPAALPLTLGVDEEVNATFGVVLEDYAACPARQHIGGRPGRVRRQCLHGRVGPGPGDVHGAVRLHPAAAAGGPPIRTMPFFAIHEQALQTCLDGGEIDLGFIRVSTFEHALGLLRCSPLAFRDRSPRADLDRARFLLARQTPVGVCNERLFMAAPASMRLLERAIAALAGTGCREMATLESRLDDFNNSRVLVDLPEAPIPVPRNAPPRESLYVP